MQNGQSSGRGSGPNCELRYSALKFILDQYKRPFTVLDIGASEGFFSFKIAKDYPATVVMIEGEDSKQKFLRNSCEVRQCNNVILLSKYVTADHSNVYRNVSISMSFLFAFNVIHHFGSNWFKAYQAILNMGDHILLETPNTDNGETIKKNVFETLKGNLSQQKSVLLGEFQAQQAPFEKHHMSWIQNIKKALTRHVFIFPAHHLRSYEIISDFTSKMLKKSKANGKLKQTKWEPGINLITFKFLNGQYPTVKGIIAALEPLKKLATNDWKPHNIIIQGNKLHLI